MTCAKKTCGRPVWGQSDRGLCWHHHRYYARRCTRCGTDLMTDSHETRGQCALCWAREVQRIRAAIVKSNRERVWA